MHIYDSKYFPPPLSPAGSSGLPKSTPPGHLWNQVRTVIHQTVTSLKPGSCFPLRTRRNQVSVTLRTQTPPLPSKARPSQAPGRVPVFHLAAPPRVRRRPCWCHWHGLSEPDKCSPVRSVAPADHQTRLRDSVRPSVSPSSGASGSLQSRQSMPLSCVWK